MVELLVTIAIIGILIALLLPSVQQARETARRMQCINNLKQIATALHNYESAHQELPAAGTYGEADDSLYLPVGGSTHHWRIDLKSGTNYSWLVKLLPYLEEDTIYQQMNLRLPVTRNEPEPQEAQPSSLLCASDGAIGRYFEMTDPYGSRMVRFGKGNYAAFTSPFHTDGWFYPGAISLYGQHMRHIVSGTSQVLVFSEVRTRDETRDERGAWALPWSGATLLAMDMHPANPESSPPYEHQQFLSLKRPEPTSAPAWPYVPWWGSVGFTQAPNGPHPDIIYECPDLDLAQVERMPCFAFEEAGYMSAAPRSNHVGGVNAAYLDGHVVFLSDDVDEMVIAQSISINGHAPPPLRR